jgi:hypothetical protein
MPIAGSPFSTTAPARAVTSMHGTLMVANETSITAFAVNKETGTVQPTDSIKIGAESLEADSAENTIFATTQKGTLAFRMSGGKLEPLPTTLAVSARQAVAPQSPPSVLDASSKFMYVIDASKAEIAAYRVDGGKPVPLTPQSYPISRGANSLTLVKP